MKFIKPFKGATGGNPFPQDFAVGDECPDDLVQAAIDAGAVDAPKTKKPDEKQK